MDWLPKVQVSPDTHEKIQTGGTVVMVLLTAYLVWSVTQPGWATEQERKTYAPLIEFAKNCSTFVPMCFDGDRGAFVNNTLQPLPGGAPNPGATPSPFSSRIVGG